jgi:hypothetical protein
MTKAHTKQARGKGITPFGLLDAVLDGTDPVYTKPLSSALFIQFTKSFKGRRQLFWSVGLRAKLDLAPELSDQELVDLPDDERASLLATLDDDDWRAVRRFRQEAHVLTVAESNPSLLRQVVQSLRDGMPVQDSAPDPAVSLPQSVVVPLDVATSEQLVLDLVNSRYSYLKGFSYGKATTKETAGSLFLSPENLGESGGLDRLFDCPGLLTSLEGGPQLGFAFDCAYAFRRG